MLQFTSYIIRLPIALLPEQQTFITMEQAIQEVRQFLLLAQVEPFLSLPHQTEETITSAVAMERKCLLFLDLEEQVLVYDYLMESLLLIQHKRQHPQPQPEKQEQLLGIQVLSIFVLQRILGSEWQLQHGND